MPRRSSKHLDASQLAKAIVDEATGEATTSKQPSAKQRAGSKGGAIGGKRRMAALSQDEKRRLAMLGVEARKGASGPQPDAPHESEKLD